MQPTSLPERISSDLNLFLVDNKMIARRRSIIQSTLAEMGKDASKLNFQHIGSAEYSKIIDVANKADTIALFTVGHEQLASLSENGSLPRIVCETLAHGYETINQLGSESNVYAVVGKITGVEVLSLLLSGFKGVLDVNSLGSTAMIRRILSDVNKTERLQKCLLIGRPYLSFKFLSQALRSDLQIDGSQWNLLLALAEIPMIKLPFSGKVPKQKTLASTIAEWSHATGYLSIDAASRNLPKIQDTLFDILTSEDYKSELHLIELGDFGTLDKNDQIDLHYLPLYARLIGLPSCLIPIRGADESQIQSLLYKGLRGTEVSRSETYDMLVHASLTISSGLVK